MALSRTSRNRATQPDYWPGFVDALSTLLLVLVFFLSIFMLAQFFLSEALSGKDAAVKSLEDQVSELAELLALERKAGEENNRLIEQLSSSLAAATAQNEELTSALSEKDANLALLNQQIDALRTQLASLEAALQAAEQKDKEQMAEIANLGKRLNAALAQKLDELASFKSEFFGRMRAALKGRTDIAIKGDRFVFQSELLFASGSAQLAPNGRAELLKVALALLEISEKVPTNVKWILQVDGHTDKVPIATAQYRSNWELSAARALAVVRFLEDSGVPSRRLSAAGYGEFQPVTRGSSPAALKRNRRIELKITTR
ncbi:MAG: peptidoglycan-binding protein [Alphaproteobacteria bacterium]